MSWKMMLVVAALAVPAIGCKTVSQDSQPASPAAVQEKAVEPTPPAAKTDPAKTDPAKTEEGTVDDQAGKAGEPAAPEEDKSAAEGTEAK